MQSFQILLAGASGRLGREIQILMNNTKLVAIEREALSSGSLFTKNLCQPSIICDVTLPEGTEKLCERLEEVQDVKMVRGVLVGTTGHSEKQLQTLTKLSKKFPICLVSNFSLGVFLLEEILKAQTSLGLSTTALAEKLGFSLSLHEVHHVHKKDSPSGTAKTLAHAGNIANITSERKGEVVGEHTVLMKRPEELLSLMHNAESRKIFAEGAIFMARKMFEKSLSPGLYEKKDILI